MYCPKCFNDSLELSIKGIFQVVINKKKLDKGRFLFNRGIESYEEIQANLVDAIEDFFKWYSTFQNIEVIAHIEVLTNNYICNSGCHLPVDLKLNAAGDFFDLKEMQDIVMELGEKYKLTIRLDEN